MSYFVRISQKNQISKEISCHLIEWRKYTKVHVNVYDIETTVIRQTGSMIMEGKKFEYHKRKKSCSSSRQENWYSNGWVWNGTND